jgi:hypothetical protein
MLWCGGHGVLWVLGEGALVGQKQLLKFRERWRNQCVVSVLLVLLITRFNTFVCLIVITTIGRIKISGRLSYSV